MIENYDSVDVFVGVDVGKGEHHAVALNRAGKVIFDKALPNDENKMRAVLQKLKQHGTVCLGRRRPASHAFRRSQAAEDRRPDAPCAKRGTRQ